MAECVAAPTGAHGITRILPARQFVQVAHPPVESAETVFQALDGRDVTVLGRRWRLEVFSVLELAGNRYVQLSVNGPARYMLTLRMRPDTEVRHVIRTLLPWLARPAGSGEVLDVDASAGSEEGLRAAE